jgi:hypothetical protein
MCWEKFAMRFYLFERGVDEHVRRSRDYLEEAHVRRVEHQAAAEHHSALAKMYGERISRIEAEMTEAVQVHASSSLPADTMATESLRLKSDSVVNYPQRAVHG